MRKRADDENAVFTVHGSAVGGFYERDFFAAASRGDYRKRGRVLINLWTISSGITVSNANKTAIVARNNGGFTAAERREQLNELR